MSHNSRTTMPKTTSSSSASNRSSKTSTKKNHELDNKSLLWAYRQMVLARNLDEKTVTLYKQNKCHFQIGCSGHEAIQVAAAKVFRPNYDWFYPYYRDLALCIGLGMSTYETLLSALNRVADPNSHGRMMPMHYGHKGLRIVPQSSPTGTQYLQAVGCALGGKMKHLDEVVYVSSGEGACAQGDFHEAINWAAREKLPVVFVIQNNGYAISVPISEQLAGESVFKLAQNYENLFSCEVNGSNIQESFAVLKIAHDRARTGGGPSLIEAHVPRLASHSISDNHLKYRSVEDITNEQMRCPLKLTRAMLLERKIVSHAEIEQIHADLKHAVDQSAEQAEAMPTEDPATVTHFSFRNPEPWNGIVEETAPSGPESFIVDAINHGLDEELARNPDMCVYGQDVAHGKGGVFGVTSGLTAKYGASRVFNSQLAESSIVGTAIGLATRGIKPVVEIQFGDYIWTGMMQIRNELAMMHYRSRGDFSCPAVIRVPVGGYIRGGAYHSQNIEATFAHFPGLHIVYPSNATDAKGLLKAAIRGQDPVLFLEHKGLYRQVYAKGNEGGPDALTPIGRAKTVVQGSDATIVTWGALVNKCVSAAEELERRGYSIEVIDIRTIVPLDIDTIINSVQRTNRVIVVHEDLAFMGFSSEIVSQIADTCFRYLDAPVKRLGMKYVAAVPHEPGLEDAVLPQIVDVENAVLELLRF